MPVRKWCINSAAKYCAIHWVEHNAIYCAATCQSGKVRSNSVNWTHHNLSHIIMGEHRVAYRARIMMLNQHFSVQKKGSGENETLKKSTLFYTLSTGHRSQCATSHTSFTHFYQLNHQSFGLFSINFPYHEHRFSFCFFGRLSLKKGSQKRLHWKVFLFLKEIYSKKISLSFKGPLTLKQSEHNFTLLDYFQHEHWHLIGPPNTISAHV